MPVVRFAVTGGSIQFHAGLRRKGRDYPDIRSVVTYESLKEISTFAADGILGGGDVVTGFEHPVAEVFE